MADNIPLLITIPNSSSSTYLSNSHDASKSINIGLIGASSISISSIIYSSKSLYLKNKINIIAIASRDYNKAKLYSDKYNIQKVYISYQDILDDQDIQAVYISLPNSLHCKWALNAIEAGKHVLLEKPMTSNAYEANMLVDAAKLSNVICFEAYHYKYHPFMSKVMSILQSGTIGKIDNIYCSLMFPIFLSSDIRYNYELGGGSLMDCGCYCLDLIRYITGGILKVKTARADIYSPNIDSSMEATLVSNNGIQASFKCSIWKLIPSVYLEIKGENESFIRCTNWVMPQFLYNNIYVRDKFGKYDSYSIDRSISSYEYMCEAFCNAILEDKPFSSTFSSGRRNMELIDEIYTMAGMSVRR